MNSTFPFRRYVQNWCRKEQAKFGDAASVISEDIREKGLAFKPNPSLRGLNRYSCRLMIHFMVSQMRGGVLSRSMNVMPIVYQQRSSFP